MYIFYLRILSYIDIEIFLDPPLVLALFEQMDNAFKNDQDNQDREKLRDAFNYYAFILYCIYQNKLINYEELEHAVLKKKLSDFLEKISLKVLTEPGTAHFYENLIREFLEDYRITTASADQPVVIKSFIELRNYFYDALGKESHPILYSQFQEFFIGYYSAKTVDGKTRVKAEYDAGLWRITESIGLQVTGIINALRPFKTYIHAFDVDGTLNLQSTVSGKLNKIIKDQPGGKQFDSKDYENFVSYNNLVLDHSSKFLNFIKEFKFPIFRYTRTWFSEEHHLKTLNDLGMTLSVDYITSNEDVEILSHPLFFRVIFYEIVNNAVKYAKGADLKLKIVLNDKNFLINFKQDKPKIQGKIGERGIRGFRQIAAIHSAEFTEDNLDQYEFTFKFPLTLLHL